MKTENMKSIIIRWVMRDAPSAVGVPSASRTHPAAATKKIYVKFRALKASVPLIVRNCTSLALAQRRAPIQTCHPQSRGAARAGCFQIEKELRDAIFA